MKRTWDTSLDSEIGTLRVTFEYDYDGGEKGSYDQPPVHPSVNITGIMLDIVELDQYAMSAYEDLIIEDHEQG